MLTLNNDIHFFKSSNHFFYYLILLVLFGRHLHLLCILVEYLSLNYYLKLLFWFTVTNYCNKKLLLFYFFLLLFISLFVVCTFTSLKSLPNTPKFLYFFIFSICNLISHFMLPFVALICNFVVLCVAWMNWWKIIELFFFCCVILRLCFVMIYQSII